MQFQYIAINQENKRLTGTISALNEAEAREQINRFGFSLIEIKPIPAAPIETADQPPRYQFEAFDKYGKKIIGTIRAEHEYAAFKRLTEEYKFQVTAICQAQASPEEKMPAGQRATILQERYEKEKKETEQKQVDESQQATETEKEKLIQQITFILNKVKEVVEKFGDEIKPPERKNVTKLVNKLLRIKNSTNLEYIKRTSAELLQKIQDKEIFLHEDQFQNEKEKLRLETQKMLLELDNINTKKNLTLPLTSKIKRWYAQHNQPDKPTDLLTKIIKFLLKPFIKEENPEETAKKQQIRKIRKQIFDYLKLLVKSPSSYRAQIFQSIQKLLQERSHLKKELKALKQIQTTGFRTSPKANRHYLLRELNSFSGWLLLFYLTYYFIAHYFLTKNIGLEIPWNFYLYNTSIKYFIIITFLFHTFTSLKLVLFPRSALATFLIAPICFILGMFVVFNF